MVGVNENDLVIFVDTILVDPVRVQDAQVTAPLAHSLLSGAPETPLEFEVVDTLAHGFTVGRTWSIKLRLLSRAP